MPDLVPNDSPLRVYAEFTAARDGFLLLNWDKEDHKTYSKQMASIDDAMRYALEQGWIFAEYHRANPTIGRWKNHTDSTTRVEVVFQKEDGTFGWMTLCEGLDYTVVYADGIIAFTDKWMEYLERMERVFGDNPVYTFTYTSSWTRKVEEPKESKERLKWYQKFAKR
jgi:hypothetical protein